jgi:hypothetical protein
VRIEASELAAIPEEHRQVISCWLLERAKRYQPSWVLSAREAELVAGTLACVAVELMEPLSEDSTVARGKKVIETLAGKKQYGQPS